MQSTYLAMSNSPTHGCLCVPCVLTIRTMAAAELISLTSAGNTRKLEEKYNSA